MILGVILAACILGGMILITTLLVTGKELNIHIRHTHKTIESCNCAKPEPNAAELQKAFNEDYAKRNQEVINMDGVIAEVNKVMGIEVPDDIKGDE